MCETFFVFFQQFLANAGKAFEVLTIRVGSDFSLITKFTVEEILLNKLLEECPL